MKKTCFFILPALVLFLCSSAFAHSAKELPTLDQDNPLSAVCTGSGVSLRAQPSSGGEKIATLDKDEELCLIGRQETKEKYPWIFVISQAGFRGWVYGRFVSFSDAALTESGRFRARFDSSLCLNHLDALTRIAGIQDKKAEKSGVGENDPDAPHYADTKLVYPEGFTLYLMDEGILLTVSLDKKGYKAAGLQAGDAIDSETLQKFNANMTSMGWSSMQAVDSGTYKWVLEAMVDTAKRPVKHFSITAEDGKIRRITWGNYVID